MKGTLLIILFFTTQLANAQDNKYANVEGRIVSDADGRSIEDASISIPYLKVLSTTNAFGYFKISQVKYGRYAFIISDNYASQDTIKVLIDTPFINLGDISFKAPHGMVSPVALQEPAIFMVDNDGMIDEDGGNDQNISGVLGASRDPYIAAVAFNFGVFRYQPRGYNANQAEVYLNGLQMNDVESGMASFGLWSGLNDMFRNQNTQFGLQSSENGFGGLSGSTAINTNASDQQKQTRFSYAIANKSYRNRIMLSHSSGLRSDGWAYAIAFSKRWSKESYVPGTSFDSYSFYLGVSKRVNASSMLHFTAFGAPTERGKTSSATLEAIDLAGSNYYNPNWGYQDGQKRNAKMNHSFQPVFMLNYDYIPDNTTKIRLVASYQCGYNANSALDWYNAQDPRPDYYRKMPSYYENDVQTANPAIAEAYRLKWLTDENVRQVDWNAMYAANRLNEDTINGMAGKRSVYMIGEDRDVVRKYSFAANLQKVINRKMNLTAGLLFISQQTESYRKMQDLLGGDYYVNLNQFAERTYPGNNTFSQNDLNRPDGIVKVGDKYSYDYKSGFIKAFVWCQLLYSANKFDFFIAARAGQNVFQREGLYKNGLFADDSYGRSAKQSFFNYQLKGGMTYKLNGRNYLFANAAVMTAPPIFDNVFISPRSRNISIDNPRVEHIKSMELGYLLRTPKLNGRLSGFATDINNAAEILRFYHGDYRTFVNYVMRNINVRHIGGEVALQMKISPSLSATAVATWMQVFYTSNPAIRIYRDNDTAKTVPQTISYLKNAYVDAGPQSAYTFGLNYRSRKLWYANINLNYLHRNYITVNPSRRTEEAIGLSEPGSKEWHAIVDPEVLAPAFTIDLFTGKSISLNKSMKWLPKGSFLYINIGVNNLLNNTDIQTAGFEQLRFDTQGGNPERFPSKYTYGFGTTYFVNISLRF